MKAKLKEAIHRQPKLPTRPDKSRKNLAGCK
jgi:hypothetical protein